MVVVFTGVLFVACGGDTTERLANRAGDVPDEVIIDFTTEESDSGLVKWRLSAPTANKFNAKKIVVMDKPTVEFNERSSISDQLDRGQ